MTPKTDKIIKPWHLDNVLPKRDTTYGAPMGRYNKGKEPCLVERDNGKAYKCDQMRIYDRCILLDGGGYDRGGAYWGIRERGYQLRVRWSADLSYIEYYECKHGEKRSTDIRSLYLYE